MIDQGRKIWYIKSVMNIVMLISLKIIVLIITGITVSLERFRTRRDCLRLKQWVVYGFCRFTY